MIWNAFYISHLCFMLSDKTRTWFGMTQIAFLYYIGVFSFWIKHGYDLGWLKKPYPLFIRGYDLEASFTSIIDICPSVATHPSVRPYPRFVLIRLARGKVGKTGRCPYSYFLQHIVSHTQIIACACQQIPFPLRLDIIPYVENTWRHL